MCWSEMTKRSVQTPPDCREESSCGRSRGWLEASPVTLDGARARPSAGPPLAASSPPHSTSAVRTSARTRPTSVTLERSLATVTLGTTKFFSRKTFFWFATARTLLSRPRVSPTLWMTQTLCFASEFGFLPEGEEPESPTSPASCTWTQTTAMIKPFRRSIHIREGAQEDQARRGLNSCPA